MPWPKSRYQALFLLASTPADFQSRSSIRLVPAVISSACKHTPASGDPQERLTGIFRRPYASRVGFGSDDDEVVIHHVASIDAVAVGHKLVLSGPIMHEQGIGITPHPKRKSLAGSNRNHVNVQSGGGSKERNDVPEQPGVLG
jgi:hypothetical protein